MIIPLSYNSFLKPLLFAGLFLASLSALPLFSSLPEEEHNSTAMRGSLTASSLMLGEYLADKNEEELKTLCAEGIRMSLGDNKEKACTHFEAAAQRGHIPSLVQLGVYYGQNHNKTEALKWYFLAFLTQWEKNGSHNFQAIKGIEVLGQTRVVENLRGLYPGKGNVPKRSEASAGIYISQPTILELGLLPEEIYALRIRYQLKLDRPEGLYAAGLAYLEGKLGGEMPANVRYLKAAQFFNEAQTPEALCALGLMYYNNFLKEDLAKEERHQKAAEHYEKAATPDALYNLACMYLEGCLGKTWSAEKRRKKAIQLLKKSGTSYSKNNLGVLYLEGSVGKDLTVLERSQKAAQLFEEAKTPESFYHLAVMYLRDLLGNTVKERCQKAAQLFEKSGIPQAKNYLGALYCEGFIGQELAEEVRYQRAKNILEEARTPESYYNLALLYYRSHLGQALTEEECYSRAIHYSELAYMTGIEPAGTLLAALHKLIKSRPHLSTPQEEQCVVEEANIVQAIETDTSEPALEAGQEISLPAHVSLRAAAPLPKKETKKDANKVRQKIENLKQQLLQTKPLTKGILGRDTASENQPFKINFVSPKIEQDFENLSRQNGRKIEEILQDIFEAPWQNKGVGKPEALKGNLKGWYSRRINEKDRLVYQISQGEILIRSCIGHYK